MKVQLRGGPLDGTEIEVPADSWFFARPLDETEERYHAYAGKRNGTNYFLDYLGVKTKQEVADS